MARLFQECPILAIGDFLATHTKTVEADLMRRLLILSAGFVAHRKDTAGDSCHLDQRCRPVFTGFLFDSFTYLRSWVWWHCRGFVWWRLRRHDGWEETGDLLNFGRLRFLDFTQPHLNEPVAGCRNQSAIVVRLQELLPGVQGIDRLSQAKRRNLCFVCGFAIECDDAANQAYG